MMVIAGAGGHALEVFDELKGIFPEKLNENFYCYDQDLKKIKFVNEFPVLHSPDELIGAVSSAFYFCLGIGNSFLRKKVFDELVKLGGVFQPVHSNSSIISDSAIGDFDALSQSFIGPDVKIGTGSLVNVGAKVHHESSLGEFVEIGPGSIVLGNASIGDFTQIGAGAVVLPGVKIGSNCKIGAGSVVTRDLMDGVVAFGVPCKVKK
ncbi:hexapeptide transferase [Algoriphagus lutimaris]|uniref:DapH/DapD/GlmU-related protein n=1 Tax=Algoriphagus lutimaris TaxID=613197 RepID=UPI00196AB2CA|nr:DapH/DapD/GlmU-related protein [Algoriphagus lutimaris]MBN3518675.1 hexapeptide transferase [Algoriphagus lutimaris]